jgi:DNA modification methylase
VEHLGEVFDGVWRVLRDDGTVFLVIGDSYSTTPAGSIKPKELIGIPWMLAFALRQRGWYLRSEIIWAKTNTTPESVTDRPTKSHETVFLLTKKQTYLYDNEAIKQPAVSVDDPRKGTGRHTYNGKFGDAAFVVVSEDNKRNVRDVWRISSEPFSGDHFAPFPRALVKPMILAGTSEAGCCSKCGAPWQRAVERTSMKIDRSLRTHPMGHTRPSGAMLSPPKATTVGWSPGCSCEADRVPCTVLDMFGGTGTTGLVALALGRNATLIESSPHYAGLAQHRIDNEIAEYRTRANSTDAWGNTINRDEADEMDAAE